MKYIGIKESLFAAHKLKEELVFNMAKSEGNSLTFAETATVMQGVSVGGKRMYELRQIEHIKAGWDEIIFQVKDGSFEVSKRNFIHINNLVAKDDNIELGDFRNSPVRIAGTKWMPPLSMLLNDEFRKMINNFENKEQKLEERIFGLFLDSARSQFFADGNKRTAQLIMNGFLMSEGYSLFSISPEDDVEYKEKLVAFYESGDKREVLKFMGKCQAQTDSRFSGLAEQDSGRAVIDNEINRMSDEQRKSAMDEIVPKDADRALGLK